MRDFLSHDDVRVTAICDVNQRNIETRPRASSPRPTASPDVKVFADFRELNADPSIDAVLMALPVHWHSIPALDAILHGKHIYHEKPMAHVVRGGAARARGGAQEGRRVPVRHAAAVGPEVPLGLRAGAERPAGQAQGNPGLGARRQAAARRCPSSRCPTTSIGTAGSGRRR